MFIELTQICEVKYYVNVNIKFIFKLNITNVKKKKKKPAQMFTLEMYKGSFIRKSSEATQ